MIWDEFEETILVRHKWIYQARNGGTAPVWDCAIVQGYWKKELGVHKLGLTPVTLSCFTANAEDWLQDSACPRNWVVL